MQKIKIRSFALAALAALTLCSLTACDVRGSEEDQPSQEEPAPSDGSQTKAQLAGDYRSCALLASGVGSSLQNHAFARYLTLNANGTYSLLYQISKATACTSGRPSGSGYDTIWSQMNVAGSWATGGTPGTPSTGSKVTLTPSSLTWTIYAPASESTAAALANWATNTCGASGFDAAASGSTGGAFQPSTCSGTSTPGIMLAAPNLIGSAQQNIFYNNGTTLETGSLATMWGVGAGGFPSAYSVNWLK